MRFGVLGPTQLVRDGQPVRIHGARPRAMLTALLLEPNQPVSLARLTGSLWDDRPPPSAVANLRTYASRLRAALGDVSGTDASRLVTAGSGYLLRVATEESDLAAFTEWVRRGRVALAGRDHVRAVALLRAGLGLWRGRIAEDVPRTTVLNNRLVAIEEDRQLAVEHLVEARMALGEHADLVAELRRLTTEAPTRERLWGRLMLSLYRCGDLAGATEAYTRARTALRESLGLDPGTELIELHRAILNRAPGLFVGRHAGVAEFADVGWCEPPGPLPDRDPRVMLARA